MSTVPLLLKAVVKEVVPVPPILRNVPPVRLLNAAGEPFWLKDPSPSALKVPELLNAALLFAYTGSAPVQLVVPALFMVRVSRYWYRPEMLREPPGAMEVTPVPLMLPPVQLITPVAVMVPAPVSV